MASTFTLTLDTTPPSGVTLDINSGAAYATARPVTAQVGATGAVQMKIWGSVDPAADANIQTTEGASSWIAFNAAQAVTLSTVDGVKTLNVKVRDAVGNATPSAATKAITLDTTVPAVTITVPASPVTISKVVGFDTTTFTFQTDTDVVAWKVKVVPATSSLESAGTTIGIADGSVNVTGGNLSSGTPQTVTIKGVDLEAASAGDGAKVVKVFAQDASGQWSTA